MIACLRPLPGLCALGAVLVAAPAHAQDVPQGAFTVSGSVTAVTDYRFRGVSRSGGDPAVQGNVTVDHASGLYVGAWASSISGGPTRGDVELDLYAGYTREILPGITADAGLTWYAYPDGHTGKAEFLEPYASLSTTYGPARLKVGMNYAWAQAALGERDNLYVYGSVDVGIPTTPVTVSAKLGYQDGALAAPFVAGGDRRDGIDYSLGASATLAGRVTLGLAYVGTSGPAVERLTDDQVVGTLSLSF